MQGVIASFTRRSSHAWISATPAARWLSATLYPDDRALTVEEHVKLSLVRHPDPPYMQLVVEQLNCDVEGAQRYLDAIKWWLTKIVHCLDKCPVALASHFFYGQLVRTPGTLVKLDLSGESNYTFHVRDIASHLPSLVDVDLSYFLSTVRTVTGLDMFTHCPKLRRVVLCGTDVANLEWVNRDVLEVLDVRWCQELVSLEGLEHGTALRELYCTMTPLSDLTPLGRCPHLGVLDLTECESLTDFAPLVSVQAQLTHLTLERTALSQLDVIRGCQRLEFLNINDCRAVQDLAPLSHLVFLKELRVESTGVSDLQPLSQCVALEVLSARRCTALFDITPLAHLEHLRHLVLSDTAVADVEALGGCPCLAILDLRSCPLTTPAATFAKWPLLSRLYLGHTSVQWDDTFAEAFAAIPFVDLREWRRPRDPAVR